MNIIRFKVSRVLNSLQGEKHPKCSYLHGELVCVKTVMDGK